MGGSGKIPESKQLDRGQAEKTEENSATVSPRNSRLFKVTNKTSSSALSYTSGLNSGSTQSCS